MEGAQRGVGFLRRVVVFAAVVLVCWCCKCRGRSAPSNGPKCDPQTLMP